MDRIKSVQVYLAVTSVIIVLVFINSLSIIVHCDRISSESGQLNDAEKYELAKLMSFEEFLKQNPRDYVDDKTERQRRKQIFDENTLFIAKHNASPDGQNFTMRQTDKEFKEFSTGARVPQYEMYDEDADADDGGGLVMAPMFVKKKHGIAALFAGKRVRPVIPDGPEGSGTHIDADLRYCSLNYDIQGNKCGCCYAFAYNSFVEWHYCKLTKGKENINLSEQFIVNCGIQFGLRGCLGGTISTTKTVSKFIGLKLEKDVPYKGKLDHCQGDKDKDNIKMNVLDWTRLKLDQTHWEQLLTEQPIVVHVKLPEEYTVYDHGIHHGEDCSDNFSHGMVLMGYGSENGEPYWILKNSQGLDWGESGYFRLSRRPPLKRCFQDGYVAKFKFATLTQDAYDDFYDSLTVTPLKKDIEENKEHSG